MCSNGGDVLKMLQECSKVPKGCLKGASMGLTLIEICLKVLLMCA